MQTQEQTEMSATHESTLSAETKARALDVLRTLPADWSLHTAWYESAAFRAVAVELDFGQESISDTVADAIALVEGL